MNRKIDIIPVGIILPGFIFYPNDYKHDEATQLKEDTKYLKYIMESVNSSTNFDTGCQNIVDSLVSNSKHIYFIDLQIGAHYIMIAQSVSDSYGSYIVFGYYSALKYCSKREGVWQQVISLQ